MMQFIGCLVLELHEGFGDVVEHGEVDPTAVVVPIHVHTKVAHSFPVD
jgi:hypothetical protein